ncbi:MAG: hypothetical protein RL582_2093 [Bacteroidota bacterium]|jgi:hypothetical protein
MKKITLTLLILLSSFSVLLAQNPKASSPISDTGNHELRLNIASSIGGMPELTYEYFPIDNMGVGLTAGVAAEAIEFLKNRAQFTGFYRVYFGKRKSCGFFIEGNMAYCFQAENFLQTFFDSSTNSFRNITTEKRSRNFGFGAAIGVKLLARNRFVGEIYAGGGRLFNKSIVGGFPRVGLSLGIRL